MDFTDCEILPWLMVSSPEPMQATMSKRPPMSRAPATATPFGGLSRGELMSRIRGADNASTEGRFIVLLRKAGITGWRRHAALPGRPDFTWRQEQVIVFLDGCFWHSHGCGRNLTPRANAAFWRVKLAANRKRDRKVSRLLRARGWRVVRIWECHLRRRHGWCLTRLLAALGSDKALSNQFAQITRSCCSSRSPRSGRSPAGGTRPSRGGGSA